MCKRYFVSNMMKETSVMSNRIEIDVKKLTDVLKAVIECLELTDKESDDIKYDYYLEILYVEGRQQIRKT